MLFFYCATVADNPMDRYRLLLSEESRKQARDAACQALASCGKSRRNARRWLDYEASYFPSTFPLYRIKIELQRGLGQALLKHWDNLGIADPGSDFKAGEPGT